jgi:hypothetical protein
VCDLMEVDITECRVYVVLLFGSFFMFSNFYRLDPHNKTHVALANLQ